MIEHSLDAAHSILHVRPTSTLAQEDFVRLARTVDPYIEATGDLAGLTVFGGKGENMYVVVPFVASSNIPSVRTFVARVKADAGAGATVSNYVMTHYNALMALKAALEKAGTVDKDAMIDAMEGMTIQSPAGAVTINKNHHVTMNMFLARTTGDDLVTVRALGEIAPEPGCK
jgi:urea transport system substrate-binding protein